MSERTPYQSPQWKAIRLVVLERDGYRCQLRLPKCKGHASHVDHIVDWRDGGSWFALDNAQSACSSCNVAKRNSRVAARARAQRGDAARPASIDLDVEDTIVLTSLSWLTPEEEAHYGPLPGPGDPPRRVKRMQK